MSYDIKYPDCREFTLPTKEDYLIYSKIILIANIKMCRGENEYDQNKYNNVKDEYKKTGKIYPIKVDYDRHNDKYFIIDGHHRCKVSLDEEFNAIHAIIFEYEKNDEFDNNSNDNLP